MKIGIRTGNIEITQAQSKTRLALDPDHGLRCFPNNICAGSDTKRCFGAATNFAPLSDPSEALRGAVRFILASSDAFGTYDSVLTNDPPKGNSSIGQDGKSDAMFAVRLSFLVLRQFLPAHCSSRQTNPFAARDRKRTSGSLCELSA